MMDDIMGQIMDVIRGQVGGDLFLFLQQARTVFIGLMIILTLVYVMLRFYLR